jgi:hypothetical protein
MSRVIEVPITNFPYPQINYTGTRNDITAFNGHLVLQPVLDEAVQKTVRGKSQQALKAISAIVRIDKVLAEQLSPNPTQPVEMYNLVAFLCDLLSLASRRAVNFRTHRSWWPGGIPVARGGFASRGPLMTNREVASLIEHGLPKLSNPVFAIDQRMLTALRWFMTGYTISAWELKLTCLWSVLEMLGKAYWENRKPDKPIILATNKKSHERTIVDNIIEPFLTDIGIPNWNASMLANRVNLHDIYTVRGHITHGDPRLEADAIRLFGPYVQKRQDELSHWAFSKHSLPDPASFGCCQYEAVHLLSRLLEKTFFNLFDCKGSMYYIRLPYHTSCPP